MTKRLDLVGKKFGKLTVVSFAYSKNGLSYWNCQCECGNTCVVIGGHLTAGHTTSCGCYHKEIVTKHKLSKNKRLYNIYYKMIRRCYNKKCKAYKWYGIREISVCDEWKNDIHTFFNWALNNGYTNSLTLDRIDVNGNYCPENCRFISLKAQQRNKRNNHLITYNGQTQCLASWCEELGLKYHTVNQRLNKLNWTVERAFETK